MPMSHSAHSSMLSYPLRSMPLPPPRGPPTLDGTTRAHATTTTTTTSTTATTSITNGNPLPPPSPQPHSDLTMVEILSELLPFFVPMPIPLDLDLSDDVVLSELLAAVTVGGREGDQVLNNVDGSSKQAIREDEDGDDGGDEREDDGDEDMTRVPTGPELHPDHTGSASVGPFGREDVSTSLKGKERENNMDVDVLMHDDNEEEQEEQFGNVAKEASVPLSAASTRATSNASTSDSGVGSSSAVWTPPKQRLRPGSLAKSKSKSTTHSSSNSGSFSPVDWSKTTTKAGESEREPVLVLKLSPRAKLVLSPMKPPKSVEADNGSASPTPNMKNPAGGASPMKAVVAARTAPVIPPQILVPSRSYTLPAPPEGSIAALRQEALGVAYTYPDSYGYGEEKERVEMVMGADAGERMLSPESENYDEEEEDQTEDPVDKKEDGEEAEDGDDMYVDENVDMDMDMGVADKEQVISEATGLPASKFESTSILARGAGSAFAVPVNKVIDRAMSSLSALTSVPSSERTSPSPSPSSSSSSAAASGSRSGSTAPSSSTSASSAPPLVGDLTALGVGPPAKVKVDPAQSNDEGPGQQDSASPVLTRLLSLPPSQTTSATTEEEVQVQDLVLNGTEGSSSPVRSIAKVREFGDEAEASVHIVHIAQPPKSSVQKPRTTPSPTPTSLAQTPGQNTPTSRQPYGVVPGHSLPTIEVEMNNDRFSGLSDHGFDADEEIAAATELEPEHQQELEAEPESVPESSPLFTSPNRPPYGDVNYQDEDFDFMSSPSKAVVSETKKTVEAKEELTTPRQVYGKTVAIPPSPEYVPSTSVSPSKLSRKKLKSRVIRDSPSPPPIRTSFMRTSPDKKRQNNVKTEKETPKARNRRSPSVICISSSDEEILVKVVKPPAAKGKIQTQAQIQRQKRPDPRPVLSKPPVKLGVFENPDKAVIIDITTPDRPARAHPPPLSPSLVVKKERVAAAMAGDVSLSLSAPLSPMGSLSPEPEVEQQLEELMQLDEDVEAEPEHEPATNTTPELPELTSESEDEPPSSSFNIKKYTAKLNDADDDADIVPVKKKRKVSASGSLAVTNAGSVIGTATASAATASEVNIKRDPDEDGGPVAGRQPLQQPKSRLTELLAGKNKKQSAALTRVKKRKRSSALETSGTGASDEERDEYDQPPLKRAKMRTGTDKKGRDKPVSKASKTKEVEKKLKDNGKGKDQAKEANSTPKRYPRRSPKGKEKPTSVTIKTPTRRPRGQQQAKLSGVVWPTVDNPNFDQFVNCDFCEVWYHIGCVGVKPGDIRLEATEIYQCPMCTAGVTKEASPVKQVTDVDVNASSRCARPNCLRPKKKKKKSYVVEEPESSFIVEAFVGRYKKFVGGQGVHEEYLVKWHTYDYHEATWELLDNMGLTNPGPLLDAFEQEAEAQGIDLSDGTEVVLFKEAADAGWTTDRLFVKHE